MDNFTEDKVHFEPVESIPCDFTNSFGIVCGMSSAFHIEHDLLHRFVEPTTQDCAKCCGQVCPSNCGCDCHLPALESKPMSNPIADAVDTMKLASKEINRLRTKLWKANQFIESLGEGNFSPGDYDGDTYEAVKGACQKFLKANV